MKPSFFSLFKRGKYYRLRSFGPNKHQQGEGTQKERKEVERFAVAAVAFCLEHDDKFLSHFWKTVCRQKGDRLQKGARIEIEENAWSDLKITNGDCVYVVEFKAGAPLDNKQNPNKREFWSKTGYGNKIKNSNKKVRYMILGYSKDLRLDKATSKHGVMCGERSWAVLCKDYPRKKLVQDLFDCLANLHIKEFQLMKIKEMQVNRRINAESIRAMQVIKEVKKAFALTGSDESDGEGKTWYHGSRVANSKLNRKRLESLTGRHDMFGWLGFEQDGDSGPLRAVWIYCRNEEKAKGLKRQLERKHFRSCRVVEDDPTGTGKYNLHITNPVEKASAPSDFEWFADIFRQLRLSEG